MSETAAAQPSAKEALARLKEGNLRFITGLAGKQRFSDEDRQALLAGQTPFAIILGCADSRVPAEIVFDQGLGDLFVIRIAGNIVAPSQIASIEFAAEMFHTPLVVVLGHTQCGAISATIEQLALPRGERSKHLSSIVDRISPAVEPFLMNKLCGHDELMQHAGRANIRMSVNQLRHGSAILESLIEQGKIDVVGAEYCLETGVVQFI